MSLRDLEAEIVAELRRILGEDDGGGTFVLRPRPDPADPQATPFLERLRGLPSGIGRDEFRRRLGAVGGE